MKRFAVLAGPKSCWPPCRTPGAPIPTRAELLHVSLAVWREDAISVVRQEMVPLAASYCSCRPGSELHDLGQEPLFEFRDDLLRSGDIRWPLSTYHEDLHNHRLTGYALSYQSSPRYACLAWPIITTKAAECTGIPNASYRLIPPKFAIFRRVLNLGNFPGSKSATCNRVLIQAQQV